MNFNFTEENLIYKMKELQKLIKENEKTSRALSKFIGDNIHFVPQCSSASQIDSNGLFHAMKHELALIIARKHGLE